MQWSSSRFRFVLVLPLFALLGTPVLAAHAGGSALGAVSMSAAAPSVATRLFTPPAAVSSQVTPGDFTASDFHDVALQGFGDPQNWWAWSMEWFNNHLIVGTNRLAGCPLPNPPNPCPSALVQLVPRWPPKSGPSTPSARNRLPRRIGLRSTPHL